jgi:hypothetical protein
MALGHRLETLHDGLTTFRDGQPVPMPLQRTLIDVAINSGLATVRTRRQFLNAEEAPIEAVMTFPVGFDSVLCGLTATIDGRRLVAVAQEQVAARETYEAGLDEGRLSILHEELLRGIHMLSVGAIPPGAEVEVELEQVVPLSNAGGVPFLRLPMTTGQIYGASPFLPSDDLVTSGAVRHEAVLTVSVDQGEAMLDGKPMLPGEALEIQLDHAIELRIENGVFGQVTGRAADGRAVTLSMTPIRPESGPLDLHVLVDRSGSTNGSIRSGACSIWEAMRDGLSEVFEELQSEDRIALWQFDTSPQFLGQAEGSRGAELLSRLEAPQGGTELADAIRAALDAGAKDVLVLTDGETWAHMVEDLQECGARITAILAGPDSLDANIGHLCALTGGQVFFAPGRDVASALRSALAALRQRLAATEGAVGVRGPDCVRTFRGGVQIDAIWTAETAEDDATTGDSFGRFAAAVSLPLLRGSAASAWARAHSLCTHMTSLVLVDEDGNPNDGLARVRKIPLMEASDCQFGAAYVAPRASPSRPKPQAYARLRSAIGGNPLSKNAVPSSRFGLGLIQHAERKSSDAISIFGSVAWDLWGDAFLTGNFSALTDEQHSEVRRLARKIADDERYSPDTAKATTKPVVLALGLIAKKLNTRVSSRFAKKALKNAPQWILESLT